MKVYILLENNKYGVNPYVFKREEDRRSMLESLLYDYSQLAGKPISDIEDLQCATFNETWIDLFETELE